MKKLLVLCLISGFFLMIQSKDAVGGDFTTEYNKIKFIVQGSMDKDAYNEALSNACKAECKTNGLRKTFTGDVERWYDNGKPKEMRCGCHAEEVVSKTSKEKFYEACTKYGWVYVGEKRLWSDNGYDFHVKCRRPEGFDYSLRIRDIKK